MLGVLILSALLAPQLPAEEPKARETINLNPVSSGKRQDEQLRELPKGGRVCDSGPARFKVRDDFDEARCREGGGEVRTVLEDVDKYPAVKTGPVLPKPFGSPQMIGDPKYDRVRANPHYHPIDESP